MKSQKKSPVLIPDVGSTVWSVLQKKKLLLLYTVAILLSFLIFLSSLSKFNQHFYLKGIMHPLELTSIRILWVSKLSKHDFHKKN